MPSRFASPTVLAIDGLTVEFATPQRVVTAVRDVSFAIGRGETVAVVGESGSGKSVTALSVMRLVEHGGGRIVRGSLEFARPGGATVDLARADAATLREKYAVHGVDVDAIEDVDVVWSGGPLAPPLQHLAPFDYIIASHVIEHLPDPLGFLTDCESLLKPSGVLSLVVPDSRYCFDCLRPLTSIGQWVDARLAGRVVHTPGTVLDGRDGVHGAGGKGGPVAGGLICKLVGQKVLQAGRDIQGPRAASADQSRERGQPQGVFAAAFEPVLRPMQPCQQRACSARLLRTDALGRSPRQERRDRGRLALQGGDRSARLVRHDARHGQALRRKMRHETQAKRQVLRGRAAFEQREDEAAFGRDEMVIRVLDPG